MADFKETFSRTVAQAEQLRQARTELVLECPDHLLSMVEHTDDPGYFQCPFTNGPAHPDSQCLRGVRIRTEERTA